MIQHFWGIFFKSYIYICVLKLYYVFEVAHQSILMQYFFPTGAKFLARLDMPQEVENHHPGLYPVPPCRKHAEEKPGGVQHAGGRSRVRPAAPHLGQQLPAAAPHGSQLQETPHHPWWCQQHLPQQVALNSSLVISLPRERDMKSGSLNKHLPVCLHVFLVRPSCSSTRSSTRASRPGSPVGQHWYWVRHSETLWIFTSILKTKN